jgi:epoxide hydrolase 4
MSPQEHSPALRQAYAEVNGVRLHYAAAGAGRLILFLHGFPEFWHAWKKQLAEFGRDHLAVAPDLRGYNLSAKPAGTENYSIPLLVEDVVGLIRHFGSEKAVLVGHDWGGALAWSTAILHPEWVEKLVVINAPHPAVGARELKENPEQRAASQYMLLLTAPGAESILAANDYALLADAVLAEGLRRGYFDEEDRQAYLQAWSQPGALTAALNYYRAAGLGAVLSGEAPADPSRVLGASNFVVETPALVLWGEKDVYLLPGNLAGLEDYVGDLRVRRIPDASHWVVHEKPELVNRWIREFIQRG